MFKESLFQEDESFSGLYYTFVVIFILAFSVAFSMFASSLATSTKQSSETLYVLLSFSISPLAIISATLLFTYLRGDSIVNICGWNKTQLKFYGIAFVAFVSVFFGLANVNTAFVEFLSKKFGYEASDISLPKYSVTNYLLVILTVCILPAVAEEVAMRGIVLRGIKCGNQILNALLGGALFSLFHMTPMQTPYQFAVGFVFSLIAIKSGSTIPTTIAHFLNNFAIVTIEYFCPTLFAVQGGWMLALTIPATLCFVAVIVMLVSIGENKQEYKKEKLKNFCMCALGGIFICTFMWVMAFLG